MQRIITIAGMLMLIYFKNNMDSWSLNTNPNNIISTQIINIVNHTPNMIMLSLYYLFLVLCLISIFNKDSRLKIITYPITFLILTLSLKLTMNLLSFEDYTEFWLMTIHHPIPLETKQYYFLMQAETIIRENIPNIEMDPNVVLYKIMPLMENLKEINWVDLKTKSPSELTAYAAEVLNMAPVPNAAVSHYGKIVTLSVIAYKIFDIFVDYLLIKLSTLNDY